MASLTSALRRIARLERALPQLRDVGACPAPPLPPETLRSVLRMLAEVGGLQGERFAAVRAALADTNIDVDELETREAESTLAGG